MFEELKAQQLNILINLDCNILFYDKLVSTESSFYFDFAIIVSSYILDKRAVPLLVRIVLCHISLMKHNKVNYANKNCIWFSCYITLCFLWAFKSLLFFFRWPTLVFIAHAFAHSCKIPCIYTFKKLFRLFIKLNTIYKTQIKYSIFQELFYFINNFLVVW